MSQYFGKKPKKRDLSNGSKTDDNDSEKLQEGSSESQTDQADILENSVESPDCQKVSFNCLKSLEQKMNDLYMPANSNKEIQIKGDTQLIHLTFSVEFLTSRKERKKRKR